MRSKYSYEYVKNVFESKGYNLLTEYYENAHQPLDYICNKHPDKVRTTKFYKILNGNGCKDCGYETVSKKVSEHKTKKYDEIFSMCVNNNLELCMTPEEYKKDNSVIFFRCILHPDKIQSKERSLFISKPTCPICGVQNKKSIKASYNEVKQAFEERGYILISQEYKNACKKLKYICPVHGEQEITYGHLKEGKGCRLCGYEKASEIRRFPYEFVKKRFEDFGLILISKEYKGNKQKLAYICPKHPDKIRYKKFPDLHYSGAGCPICGNESTSESKKHDIDFVRKKLLENGIILLEDKYYGQTNKMLCTCVNHTEHRFYISYAQVMRSGYGCDLCSGNKGEVKISKFLSNNSICYESEKTFDGLRGVRGGMLSYDFYIKEKNILIEFQGQQHEYPIEYFGGAEQFAIQQEHDKRKREFAIKNKIKLIEIWYYDFNNIEKILEEVI